MLRHCSGIECRARGDPGVIRTRGPKFRKLVLYPAELRGRARHRLRGASLLGGDSAFDNFLEVVSRLEQRSVFAHRRYLATNPTTTLRRS